MIVIADTSVVLNLCQIGSASLLRELYGEVIIPEIVAQEFKRLAQDRAQFSGLDLPDFISIKMDPLAPQSVAQASLDPGEKAAIALALISPGSLLLIDEAKGRSLAVKLGVITIGTLGILLEAKSQGFISAIAPLLNQLTNEAGFWVAPALRA